MKSVQQEIILLLNQDLAVQKCLKRGLMNLRALANYLIETYELNYTLDAVISAIRRYDAEVSELAKENNKETKDALKSMSIYTKDAVTRIILKDKLFSVIGEDYLNRKLLKENFRLIKGKEKLTLIVTQKDLEQKLSIFKSSEILLLQKDLSEIRLEFSKDISKIKGIIFRLAGELNIRGVNIVDLLFSTPEILVYVQEKDLIKALEAIKEIREH